MQIQLYYTTSSFSIEKVSKLYKEDGISETEEKLNNCLTHGF